MELVQLRDSLVRFAVDEAREAAKRAKEDFPEDVEARTKQVAETAANACIVVVAGGDGSEYEGPLATRFRTMRDHAEDAQLDQVIASIRNRLMHGIRHLLDTAQKVKPTDRTAS